MPTGKPTRWQGTEDIYSTWTYICLQTMNCISSHVNGATEYGGLRCQRSPTPGSSCTTELKNQENQYLLLTSFQDPCIHGWFTFPWLIYIPLHDFYLRLRQLSSEEPAQTLTLFWMFIHCCNLTVVKLAGTPAHEHPVSFHFCRKAPDLCVWNTFVLFSIHTSLNSAPTDISTSNQGSRALMKPEMNRGPIQMSIKGHCRTEKGNQAGFPLFFSCACFYFILLLVKERRNSRRCLLKPAAHEHASLEGIQVHRRTRLYEIISAFEAMLWNSTQLRVQYRTHPETTNHINTGWGKLFRQQFIREGFEVEQILRWVWFREVILLRKLNEPRSISRSTHHLQQRSSFHSAQLHKDADEGLSPALSTSNIYIYLRTKKIEVKKQQRDLENMTCEERLKKIVLFSSREENAMGGLVEHF